MTTFEIRFNELLALFRVTNKQLATALNVDPSLVSRWKNGQRYPSIKYNQMQDIAQFFLNLKQNDQEKQA
ncbi:MAG: helix-turn-helix transcriptional regulator, partial [Erysipelothrix sp.]|nr:helix-turn-helix transcriptional regulator [Erysipelothrix sp.]